MANATRISNAAAIAACNAIVDLIDAGTPPGKLQIWDDGDGAGQPAGPDTAVADDDTPYNLLAELTLNDSAAFGDAADANPGATATAAAITGDASANKTGTAAWFRVTNAAGTAIIDGSVGLSGCDLNLNSVDIQAGVEVNITSWTVTMPES
jgi:hypothetical protein